MSYLSFYFKGYDNKVYRTLSLREGDKRGIVATAIIDRAVATGEIKVASIEELKAVLPLTESELKAAYRRVAREFLSSLGIGFNGTALTDNASVEEYKALPNGKASLPSPEEGLKKVLSDIKDKKISYTPRYFTAPLKAELPLKKSSKKTKVKK